MGRVKTSRRRTSKNKQFKKSHDVKRRTRDIDQVQDDVAAAKMGIIPSFELDEDLPGQGQFYCMECARHFHDQITLDGHRETKVHKRKLKDVAQQKYTQVDAELAAGRTKEVLPPAHAQS